MSILYSIAIGGVVGLLSALLQRQTTRAMGSATVGMMGGLLGAAATIWLRGLGSLVEIDVFTSALVGSGMLLLLWNVGERLFLRPPVEAPQR